MGAVGERAGMLRRTGDLPGPFVSAFHDRGFRCIEVDDGCMHRSEMSGRDDGCVNDRYKDLVH